MQPPFPEIVALRRTVGARDAAEIITWEAWTQVSNWLHQRGIVAGEIRRLGSASQPVPDPVDGEQVLRFAVIISEFFS